MKKIYLFAAAALAMASCTSDEFVGNSPGTQDGSDVISFGAAAPKNATRAAIDGAEAAKKLGEKFTVYGWKTNTNASGETAGTHEDVYQDYLVKWTTGSNNTTESNTAGWEYVGNTTQPLAGEGQTQHIHYWDYSTSRYDFIAWNIKEGNAVLTARPKVTGTGVEPSLTFSAPTAADLAKIYISDKYTATPDGATIAGNLDNASNTAHTLGQYKTQEVSLQFRSLAAKARIGIYETVPGYQVSDVIFYKETGTNAWDYTYSVTTGDYQSNQTHATLYAEDATAANAQIFVQSGDVTVKYHDKTYESTDTKLDNTAYAEVATGTKSTFFAFGKLTNERGTETAIGSNAIGTTSATASMTIGNDDTKLYTYVFPMEGNTQDLHLKVNYKLTATDGSDETIYVTGANAVVPAEYAKWMANYAYTYIFKISDNTNGYTGPTTDPAGLYPITFDAVVVNAQDGNQETITTVADNCLTTYQLGSKVTENDEYVPSEPIYVVDEAVTATTTNTKLYVAEAYNGVTLTEAALQHKAVNGIALVDISSELTDATEIPSQDAHTIAMNCVKFTPVTGYTYVVEHEYATGKNAYKVIKVTGSKAVITYTFSDATVDEGATVDVAVTANYNGTAGMVVTGAAGAFEIADKNVTVAEKSGTPGTYVFTANAGAATTTLKLGSTTKTLTVNEYTLNTSAASIAVGNKATITMKLGGAALTDGDDNHVPTIVNAPAGLTLTNGSNTSDGKYVLAATKAVPAGTYTVKYLGASVDVEVVPYTLSFTDAYVNKGNATAYTIANTAVVKDLNTPATASLNTTANTITDGTGSVTPSEAGTLKLTYQNASATIIVKDFALANYDASGDANLNGTLGTGEKFVKLTESGEAYVAENGALTATAGSVVATSVKGVYKVSDTATITYKYKGVTMVTL